MHKTLNITGIKKNKTTRILAQRTTKVLVSVGFILVSFGVCGAAQAANLYLSPANGSYLINKSFSVSVYVSSADKAMNAASGVVKFAQDKLEVVSVSKTGSIFSLWAQEPAFSNSAGTVSFEGIVLNPGYTGASGKILTINFRTKNAGSASLSFSSGSVLANDGKGTNILQSLGSAAYNIEIPVTGPAAPTSESPVDTIGAPAAPQIYSDTNPNPDKWYSTKSVKFSWEISPDITAVRSGISQIPQEVPTQEISPAIKTKEFTDVADGVWYFHLRLKNKAGWGGVTHFRFQVDSEKPDSFEVKEVERVNKTDPIASFLLTSHDKMSGVDRYEIEIDGAAAIIWMDDGSHVYKTADLLPGKHHIAVRAFDKAGNYDMAALDFLIDSLTPPTLVEYPAELLSGDPLIIRGYTTYLDSTVTVWLQKDSDDPRFQKINIYTDGKFTYVYDERTTAGIYKVWAEVMDKKGAKSDISEVVVIQVTEPAILRIGSLVVSVLAVLIPLVALLLLLFIILWYSFYRFKKLKASLKKDTKDIEQRVQKAFGLLSQEIPEQLKMLKKARTKNELTENEEKLAKQLKQDLYDAERFIKDEIDAIKKELDDFGK
jgi:hypothetical protein